MNNPNNPLSKEHIQQLKQARDGLKELEKRIADAKRAGVPLPDDIDTVHKTMKDRIDKLLLVYGDNK